jgi:small GTP-binding protein
MSKLSEIKLVLVGETNVGKTSLVTRYLFDRFDKTSATIAAQFMLKVVTFGGVNYKLQIWDTAGQERFRAMAPLYYRNADIALVVCDVTQQDFSSSVKYWISKLQESITTDANLVTSIVVNKSDFQEADWTIQRQDLADLVQSSNAGGCDVYVTSALENKGVASMFEASIEKCLERRSRTIQRSKTEQHSRTGHLSATTSSSARIEILPQHRSKKPSCC